MLQSILFIRFPKIASLRRLWEANLQLLNGQISGSQHSEHARIYSMHFSENSPDFSGYVFFSSSHYSLKDSEMVQCD